jgi:hypothetical protein
VNLSQLKDLFVKAGCTKLYAKPLAVNDNSKNQVYFAGAVEALNVFPSEEIFAENSKRHGPTFKARLKFGWLLENGSIAPAPGAQLILYSQYPEVRFSGFLQGSKGGPGDLMADRQRASRFPPQLKRELVGRVLFLGVTRDRRTLGYVAPGNSQVAAEFNSKTFPLAFVVFREVPLAVPEADTEARTRLLQELGRIHRLGWIDSKQLDADGRLKPCNAPQCGGFTLEAELGIAKNSSAEPDFLGWEVKQYAVEDFDKIESSKPITLMTPEPSGGFYRDHSVEAFIRKFGYADKMGREDRMNFGGRHFVGSPCLPTGLTMQLVGFDSTTGKITDADGEIALLSGSGETAASWSFKKILEHWSRKHTKAVYVPSKRKTEPLRQYSYANKVRLAQKTDSLRLLRAFAIGSVYYDPGIKLERASTNPEVKRRSQFRIASKSINELYETVETVEV